MIEIPLSGAGAGLSALVDDELADHFKQYRWFLGTDGYARRTARKNERDQGSPRLISMHREVLGIHLQKGRPGSPEVDHINRSRLDNRRDNLRITNRSINSRNSEPYGGSSYKGVSFFRPAKMWRYYVDHNNCRTWGGYSKCEEDAARRRDRLLLDVWPEAVLHPGTLNFPSEVDAH